MIAIVRFVRVALLALLVAASVARSAPWVFRQGLNGYAGTSDTWLEFNNDESHGDEPTVSIDAWLAKGMKINDGLLRFEGIFGVGSDHIPLGTAIASATLSVCFVSGQTRISRSSEFTIPGLAAIATFRVCIGTTRSSGEDRVYELFKVKQ